MLFIVAAIVLWSTLGLVIRFSGLPIHLLIFSSCLISAVIMGPLIILKGSWKGTGKGKTSLFLLLLGPVSLVNTFSFYYAYRNTTIALAVLTHYTAPIFVAFLAPFFLKEKLTLRIAAAVALSTAGLLIMLDMPVGLFISQILSGDSNSAGILAGILSGFAYAMLIIIIRAFSVTFDPLFITFVQNTMIAAFLLPFIPNPPHLASSLWVLFVMGVIHYTVAPVLYLRGMKEVQANTAAILGYLEPVCAIILGFIFLQEQVNAETVAGGLLILFSGYLTVRS